MASRNNSRNERMIVNSVGEGAMWICNSNGNIENGDYIQSSNHLGYGEKQDDDFLHNYTVGKATIDCNFELGSPFYNCLELDNNIKIAFIACTYHCDWMHGTARAPGYPSDSTRSLAGVGPLGDLPGAACTTFARGQRGRRSVTYAPRAPLAGWARAGRARRPAASYRSSQRCPRPPSTTFSAPPPPAGRWRVA